MFISCIGCTHKEVETKEIVNNSAKKININIKDDFTPDMSKIAEEHKFIKLETLPKSLIDEVLKIKFKNKKIYISGRASIWIFDLNGKFLNTISYKGEGPNEYKELGDFYISDDTIEISDWREKIIRYKENGTFINSDKVDILSQAFYKIANNKYLFYLGNYLNEKASNKKLIVHEFNPSKITSQYIDVNPNIIHYHHISDMTNLISSHNGAINFLNSAEYNIYTFRDGLLSIEYEFDFGKNNIPTEFVNSKFSDVADFFGNFRNKKYAYLLDCYFEGKNTNFVTFELGESRFYLLFDKSKYQLFSHYNDDLLFNNRKKLDTTYENTPRGVTEDGYFVYLLEPANYLDKLNTIKDSHFKSILASSKVSDNPILYLIKMKSL